MHIDNTLRALDLIAQRHKALSSNVANMDTPNYTRKDVSFSEYIGNSISPLETSLSKKMGPSPISIMSSDEEINPATELSEMKKNSILYTVATRRLNSIITEMKTVINMGG